MVRRTNKITDITRASSHYRNDSVPFDQNAKQREEEQWRSAIRIKRSGSFDFSRSFLLILIRVDFPLHHHLYIYLHKNDSNKEEKEARAKDGTETNRLAEIIKTMIDLSNQRGEKESEGHCCSY